MQTKYKVIIVVVTVATAFAAGRWSAPVQIKTETKIVEVEKKVTEEKKNKKKETKIVKTTKPDGSSETTTTIVENTNTDKDSTTGTTVNSDTKTEEKKSESLTTISAMGGVDLTTGKTAFGASVYRPVLGPVGIGVWGLTNATCGINIGLSF